MTRITYYQTVLGCVLTLLILCPEAFAQRGGGGARENLSNRATNRTPTAPARPSSSPNLSRPTAPANRPNINRPTPPTASRPSINRPSTNNVNRPSLPTQSRPNPVRPELNRPSTPGINRPTGGMTPSINRPTRPTPPTLDNRPGPTQRPNIERPTTSLPTLPSRPTTRPEVNLPNRPEISRPGTRPSLPGNIRPETRPSLPNIERPVGGERPGSRPGGVARPRPGDVGDFLGFDRPLRPETRPSIPGRPGGEEGRPRPERPSRPSLPEDRPTRPEIPNRPNRPERPDRPGGSWNGQRPDWINSNRPQINNINQRPGWVNIDNSVNIQINNRWTTVVNQRGPQFVTTWPRNRTVFWNSWGFNVRRGWSHHHYHWYFNDHWWMRHPHVIGGWHYSYGFAGHPWRFWWNRPAWPVMQTWFVWAPQTPQIWTNPVQFDYGTGGNIYIVDNRVFLGGQEIATAAEFAMTSAELATVPPPESVEQAEAAEWLPLGTFAFSTSQEDVEPARIIQLAVNREGIVSGTMFNTLTEISQTVQGKVDPETQRVAFRIGESETLVVETGLYNLTQDEVPIWVHYGPERTETYLMVRLEYDEDWDADWQ